MSADQALYRKYRPQTFDEVLGQDEVVGALKGAINNKRIGHAYLFVGSRGIGKTTLARIFAREIGTSDRDLIEMDAASNRGIDHVRALREEACTLPFESTYKVYVLDEVHMLTKDAWNAFLKMLEEPPKHVVFILATTEVDKIPETILSRCQIFTLKRPTSAALKEMVLTTARKEGYTLETASAELIALLADGAFRDAHGILQKVIAASSDKKLTHEEVERVTGSPKSTVLLRLLDAIVMRDVDTALAQVHHLSTNGGMKIALALLLRLTRAVLIARTAPDFAQELELEFTAEEWEHVVRHAQSSKETINSTLLTRLLDAHLRTGTSYTPELPLELALIDHLTPSA